MPQLCIYLQLHQPYRLDSYGVFDLGNSDAYFESEHQFNRTVFEKVAQKSYRPMLRLLIRLARRHADFRVTLSASGVFLEQAEHFAPDVIELIKELLATGQLELLAETYHHSLAALYSEREFREQIALHAQYLMKLFEYKPLVFRNTELIYTNQIAEQVAKLGYKGMLTEAVERYLNGESRTQLFIDKSKQLPLLLKHAQLSDDVAFRFSDRNWDFYPLGVEQYLHWLEVYGENELVNLFMDFETFGEHQWADTGIFEFFNEVITRFLEKDWNRMVTPSMTFSRYREQAAPVYDVPNPISWADVDRDITAWVENPLQQDSLRVIYDLERKILSSEDTKLIENWRKLQTSDHFYYMCTKWSADGDVHAYFSPYDSPYEAYRRYAIALANLL